MTRRRNAWLTPNTGTGETLSRCITMPIELLPYVTGALSALTEPWRWEQYGTMTPSEAAYLSSAMLAQFLNDCEGSNVLLRQNENEPCILERSDDNGVTWVPFADMSLCATDVVKPQSSEYTDVRENPTTGELEFSLDGGTTWTDIPVPSGAEPTNPWAPARSPTPGATQGEQRCMAATRAANNLNDMYKQTYGAIAAGLNNTLTDLNVFLRDLNDFLAGIVWGTYWDIAKALGFSFYYDPVYYQAEALNAAALDALTCLLYENATVGNLGVVSFDYGAVRDNVIAELGINPGTAVWTHLNYLSEAGLNRLADIGFGSTDCSLCEQPSGYWFNWEQLHGEDDRAIDNEPGQVTFPVGWVHFIAGLPYTIHGEGYYQGGTLSHTVEMHWDGDPMWTDRIDVGVQKNNTGGSSSLKVYVNDDVDPIATTDVPNSTTGVVWRNFNLGTTRHVYHIRAVSYVSQSFYINMFNGLRMWLD